MTREIIATAIKDMPLEFDLDELIRKIIFIEEIEAARKEVREGKTIPFEEVKKIASGWGK